MGKAHSAFEQVKIVVVKESVTKSSCSWEVVVRTRYEAILRCFATNVRGIVGHSPEA